MKIIKTILFVLIINLSYSQEIEIRFYFHSYGNDFVNQIDDNGLKQGRFVFAIQNSDTINSKVVANFKDDILVSKWTIYNKEVYEIGEFRLTKYKKKNGTANYGKLKKIGIWRTFDKNDSLLFKCNYKPSNFLNTKDQFVKFDINGTKMYEFTLYSKKNQNYRKEIFFDNKKIKLEKLYQNNVLVKEVKKGQVDYYFTTNIKALIKDTLIASYYNHPYLYNIKVYPDMTFYYEYVFLSFSERVEATRGVVKVIFDNKIILYENENIFKTFILKENILVDKTMNNNNKYLKVEL